MFIKVITLFLISLFFVLPRNAMSHPHSKKRNVRENHYSTNQQLTNLKRPIAIDFTPEPDKNESAPFAVKLSTLDKKAALTKKVYKAIINNETLVVRNLLDKFFPDPQSFLALLQTNINEDFLLHYAAYEPATHADTFNEIIIHAHMLGTKVFLELLDLLNLVFVIFWETPDTYQKIRDLHLYATLFDEEDILNFFKKKAKSEILHLADVLLD